MEKETRLAGCGDSGQGQSSALHVSFCSAVSRPKGQRSVPGYP